MKTYVFDANPVIELLQGGRDAQVVANLLTQALRRENKLLLSVLNAGEVLYVVWQQQGEEAARRAIANLSSMPVHLVDLDMAGSLKAGEIKARHYIPYVDCVAAALAALNQATLVTSDRHFERLGGHFPVLWIRRS
jgi:predicted nucleic acid-binding protein